MEKYSKKVGKYYIVADGPSTIKNYTDPDGKVLNKNTIWNDQGAFYEQDYFAISVFKSLHVVDENGNNCSPIIREIEFKNEGYVITWPSLFWMQGYAVIGDDIFFVTTGDNDTYYRKFPKFYKLITSEPVETDFSYFLEKMVEEIPAGNFVEAMDWHSISKYMLE